MRTERSPMRMRERDQCASEIRTNGNREKSREEEIKVSVCKWDKDQ
jgi:hypothetical protein